MRLFASAQAIASPIAGRTLKAAEYSRASRLAGWHATRSPARMLHDLSYAFRTLVRARAFTITAALTLALGIGANTVMFSVVNAVLLRPLPFRAPDRLMLLFSVNSRKDVGQIRATALDFFDWRSGSHSFDAMAGNIGTGYTFSDGEPEFVMGQLVTADFFNVLGVP